MKIGRNGKILIFFGAILAVTIPLIWYNFSVQNPIIWELKISGNVNQEVIIHYQQLVDGDYGMITDREFYFKNSFGTEDYYIFSGASLWQILNQTGVLRGNSSEFYFRCADNYETATLSLASIQANPQYVIIAFKQGDDYIKPKSEGGDGPLRAVVDYELTKPAPNSQYWAKYVNEVIII